MTYRRAHLLLLLAAIMWGLGNVAQKTILEHMGPLMATGLSSLLGAIALWPLLRTERPQRQPSSGADGPSVSEIAVASLAFFAAIASMQFGYSGTSVSNAGFLVNTCTVITPLAAWFVMRERPSAAVLPSIALVMAGVWLMGGASFTALTWGDGVCLVSAVMFAVSITLNSRFVLLYGFPARLTITQFLFTGGVCFALSTGFESNSYSGIMSAWPELLMMGIVSKAIPYFLMAFAQQHTSASATSIIASSEGIFGALCAAIFLGESMPAMAVAGAALIMVSIVLLQLLPRHWIDSRRPKLVAATMPVGVSDAVPSHQPAMRRKVI